MRHLLNHRVRVYRDAEGTDAFGSTSVLTPGAIPEYNNARPDQAWSGDQQRAGGEMQGAHRRWFLSAGVDVAERDVLEVLSGTEAPSNLRVVSVTKVSGRRGLHHIEVNVETYSGELVTEAET